MPAGSNLDPRHTSRFCGSQGANLDISIPAPVSLRRETKSGPALDVRQSTATRPKARFITPMAAQVVDALPDGDDWIYEVKFDGYRALIVKNGDRIEIRSRNDKDLTAAYPGIVAAARKLHAQQATVDGEIVAVDAQRPAVVPGAAAPDRASRLRHRVLCVRSAAPGRTRPDRRAARRAAAPAAGGARRLRASCCRSICRGTCAHVIEAVQALGLEGVIAKRRSSRYTPGERGSGWLKLKLDKQQEFVVGGYRPGPDGVDALLVGYYDGRQLRFAGKVRAGFTPHLRREVVDALKALPCRAMSVRRSAPQQDVALGRRRDGRADGRDAVGEAGARRADPVRRMDR